MKFIQSHLFGCFVVVSVGFASFQLLVQHAILHQQEMTHREGLSSSSKSAASVVQTKVDPNSLHENHGSSFPQYHMVFSTSCTPQQDWESMVFFYHAHKVQQAGTVTRIVSGCSPSDQKAQQEFFTRYIQPMNSLFAIHFTPDFSNLKKAHGHAYKYMNKPYGLQHWMTQVLRMHNTTKHDNDIILLLDPDMILLRPLTHDFSDVDQHLWASNLTRVVKPGFPICQQDGYLTSSWTKLNATHIMGESHPPVPSNRDGPLYWNSGPPYLATARDMFRIVEKWTVFTPRVLDEYPELFAEMYGLIFATVHLQLPFTMIPSIVVSTTTTEDREGWEFVDDLTDEQICQPTPRGVKAPIALHYCKRYMYGPMFFSKYRLKKNIMSCEKSLLEDPPNPFVGQYNYSMKTPKANERAFDYKPIYDPIKSPKIARREAYMLCGLTRAINEALEHHKQVACPSNNANLVRNYTVFNSPSQT